MAYRSLVRSELDGCPTIGLKLLRELEIFATISSGVIVRQIWRDRRLEGPMPPFSKACESID